MPWLLLPLILRVSVTFNAAALVADHIGSEYDDSDMEIV